MAVNRKRFKWIAKFGFVLFVILPCCNCCSYFFLGLHILEIPIHLRLAYYNAQFIDEVAPACGSSEVWAEYVYWWTEDSFEKVSSRYRTQLPDFRVSDDGLTASARFKNIIVPIPFLTLPDPDAAFYDTVWLDLYSLNDPELSLKASPGHCGASHYRDRPSGRFINNPPPHGTLIVYSYLVWKP